MSLWRHLSLAAAAFLYLSAAAQAASEPAVADSELDQLLKTDIADLVVTSVSKRPERLAEAAAAVYVITAEDIHRAGITSMPEALRMSPGVEVARVNSYTWAISIRGFNGALANKLLVLVDGRSIYTPIYGGTYWDDRMLPVEEIDRIEVIRGPGASVWGANAMNGVINIITKRPADTQGNFVSQSIGTGEAANSLVQHGGKLGDDTYYRAYADYLHRGPTETTNGTNNFDSWERGGAGFRVDRNAKEGDSYRLIGNAYGGDQDTRTTQTQRAAPFTNTVDTNDHSYGASLTALWEHQFSATSNGSLQAYFDHYTRLEEIDDQHVNTFDLEWQHNLQTSDSNHFTWGAGYRHTETDLIGSFEIRVSTKENETFNLYSAFLQDDYQIIDHELTLTLGSKFEHNDFTGYEVQPTARLSWTPTSNQTVWGAVSRAVRTPSIIEDEITLIAQTGPPTSAPPSEATYLVLFGNQNQKAETLTAYELGYRVQPTSKLELDTTAYYNQYDNLLTATAGTPYISGSGLTDVVPFTLSNMGQGSVWGGEASATWTATRDLKLMGSYSYGKMDLGVDPGAAANLDSTEALMPRQMFSARAYWNLQPNIQWDNMLYYVSGITRPANDYVRYDTRLGWEVEPGVEVSLIGRNLFEPRHAEFPATPQAYIDRSLIGRVTIDF